MDTSLKRLWTRKKSKGNDGRKDSGVSSLRKSQSTEQTQHSTSTSPRSSHNRNISSSHGVPQFGPPLSNRALLTSSGGVFSRPSTSRSRPATDGSGSMLNAVNRAADAVAKAEQEFQHSAERYTRDHIRPKTPRYIDIFSLSSSNSPNPKPGYNEDVAERNLDLGRVALEGTHYHYVPSSKYQEEVAARNAHPSLPASPQTSPSVREGVFNGSQSPGQMRGAASALSDYPRSPQRFEDRSSSRQSRNTPGSAPHHFRQYSDRSRESQHAHELSVPGENVAHFPHTQISPHLASGGHDPEANYTLMEVPARHPGRGLGEYHVHEIPADSLSSYQLSASEVTQMKSTEQSSYSQGHEYPVRSPSNLSNPSSVKRAINLSNRTIMDLTGDDPGILAESSPLSNHISSPVVEHAKVDSMGMVQVPVLSSSFSDGMETQSNSSQSASSPPVNTEPPLPAEVSQHLNSSPEPALEELTAKKTPINGHFVNSFTPIITIASASPRTSVVMEKSAASVTVQDTQEENKEDENHNLNESRSSRDSGSSSHDGSPESRRRGTKTTVVSWEERRPYTNTAAVDIGDGVSQTLEAAIVENVHSTQDLEAILPSGPYVHLSTGNIETTPPGVSTRDFAITATKSPLTSVPEDPELDENGSVPLTAIGTNAHHRENSSPTPHAHGHIAVAPLYQSTFDETEFAQKQAEARDALVRLQLSLNENFLAQPISATDVHSSKSSPSRHVYSFSDGRPAAPSYIFSQIRESSPVSVNTRAELDDSRGSESPRTSIHNLTTVTLETDLAAAPSEKLMYPNGKAEKKPQNGNQRMEAGLNGPGPSIVNDAPKQPRPLPLQLQLHLHLADDPFHQRFPHLQSVVPPSPGEISLSNFPIPVSSPRQSVQRPPVISSAERERSIARPVSQYATHHAFPGSPPRIKERILRRQPSTNSQSSSTSQFSIPYHMIPDRSSSRRDRSVMEDDDE